MIELVASEVNATPAQVALAWLLTRGDDILPIQATRWTSNVDENIAALKVRLEPGHLDQLEQAFPPGVTAGARYPEKQMGNMGL